jgi:hypothetical protein
MVTSGLAFFLIAVVYILVDVKHWWNGQPFLAAGNLICSLFCLIQACVT